MSFLTKNTVSNLRIIKGRYFDQLAQPITQEFQVHGNTYNDRDKYSPMLLESQEKVIICYTQSVPSSSLTDIMCSVLGSDGLPFVQDKNCSHSNINYRAKKLIPSLNPTTYFFILFDYYEYQTHITYIAFNRVNVSNLEISEQFNLFDGL